MPTSVAFYRDVLGFTVVKQSGSGDDFDWGLLQLGSAELMLNTAYDRNQRPPRPDMTRIAAHEDAVFYFGCRDVDAAYAHLRAKGIDVQPPKLAWYGMKQRLSALFWLSTLPAILTGDSSRGRLASR